MRTIRLSVATLIGAVLFPVVLAAQQAMPARAGWRPALARISAGGRAALRGARLRALGERRVSVGRVLEARGHAFQARGNRLEAVGRPVLGKRLQRRGGRWPQRAG